MSPFDKVTYDVEIDGITYTKGAEVICTYTEDNTDMCVIQILGSEFDLLKVKQSEVTVI